MKTSKNNIKKVIVIIFFLTNIHSMEITNSIEKNRDREDSLTNVWLLSTTYLASLWLGYKTGRKTSENEIYNKGINRMYNQINKIKECPNNELEEIKKEIECYLKNGSKAYVIKDIAVKDQAIIFHEGTPLKQSIMRSDIKLKTRNTNPWKIGLSILTNNYFETNKANHNIAYVIKYKNYRQSSIKEKPLDHIIDII